jgi:2-succinyl-6-hydroxy-2,4-cyclohexadiene-1-carboxylate synthase
MQRAAEQRDVEVGGDMRLHVERSGGGPPLLLLHGFTGSVETWRDLRDAVDGRYTTIALDLPGHGRSDAPADPARYALDALADDLARVLDVLDVAEVAVLGYSMGGRAALQLALRHPRRVCALVLESTSPGILDERERAARVTSDRALAADLEAQGIEAFVDRWERLPLWESQAALSPDARAALRAQRLANRPRGLANSLRGAGAGVTPSVLERLPALDVPTLLITGALDTKFVALTRTMEGALPQARVVVVPDAGHAVHLERPQEFARLVNAFLDG